VAAIKQAAGGSFLTVVPGIRPSGGDVQDQKRIATPIGALHNGADILVIGRAITGAADPVRACTEIKAELDAR
jgi:orotidine-5'-phosphate decarboxylase